MRHHVGTAKVIEVKKEIKETTNEFIVTVEPEDLRYIKEKKGFSNNTEMWEWISSEVDSMLKWECVKDEVRESL